jgi:hypothetical protein
MMTFENIQVQLIDTPPLSGDFADPLLIELIKRGVFNISDTRSHLINAR